MFQAHKEREFEVDLPVATAANIASSEDNCSFLDYKLRSPDSPIDRAVMSSLAFHSIEQHSTALICLGVTEFVAGSCNVQLKGTTCMHDGGRKV